MYCPPNQPLDIKTSISFPQTTTCSRKANTKHFYLRGDDNNCDICSRCVICNPPFEPFRFRPLMFSPWSAFHRLGLSISTLILSVSSFVSVESDCDIESTCFTSKPSLQPSRPRR
ncbi:hypothetical protein DPMN_184287 [Dreissena polymorpha]|uniref:Uncharacterized protein n=1 Tax=Dreissena polymorpha TaxID=45954 RepID=A0A9D4DI83_DREPO|nr:hypothetical protein DPMN_184287 [Dreissena polymorpha]